MSYTIIECEQRSPEWFEVRRGKITASNAHRLLTSAKFSTFKYELLAETLTPYVDDEGYVNDAMQRGIDLEPVAIDSYCEDTEATDVYKVGFCISLEYPICGASPDILVDEDGLGEVKCPNTATHFRYIEVGPTSDIIAQMNFQMFVLEREWVDFITFDDRPTEECLHKHVKRFHRDRAMISEFAMKAKQMNEFINNFRMDHGV